MPEEPRGWHARGYLPHYDDGLKLQAITYRLADALPAEAIARLEEMALDDDARRRELERYLDAGHGSCLLRDAAIARAVIAVWKHEDGIAYQLHAWVVMPNHVHVLVEPKPGVVIGEIVGAWKSISARKIIAGSAAALGRQTAPAAGGGRAPTRKRRVWQPDYWDRFIRNERHYRAAIDYIHANPMQAGFVSRAEDWPWSSLNPVLSLA